MSPEAAEVARALVASPRWEWRAGVRAGDGDICVRAQARPPRTVWNGAPRGCGTGWFGADDGRACDGYAPCPVCEPDCFAAECSLPDLDDPATAGVLLGMLLEAKPYGTRWSGPVVPVAEQHVSIYVGDHREYFLGPTLGVAVGRALLAVWGAK